jgi:aerobic C4-dicarboxylate transport protein
LALAIGLVVGNPLHPGAGLHLSDAVRGQGADLASTAEKSGGTVDFLLGLIPTTLLSAPTSGSVAQALLIALLVGFAIQAMGRSGEPLLRGIGHLRKLVFRILAMVMWVAPIGAFGAIAAVVGETGLDALKSLAVIMIGFYATCAVFVFGILGLLLRVVAQVNVFSLLKYLGREFLLILSTSSSETALPRLVAEMEHSRVSQLDRERLSAALTGANPFDESRMIDDHADEPGPGHRVDEAGRDTRRSARGGALVTEQDDAVAEGARLEEA